MNVPLRLLGPLFALYVSQGLPFHLFIFALPALLREAGARLDLIGLLPLCFLPVALKALWAPLVDRGTRPRLGWIIPAQLVAMLALAVLALVPLNGPIWPLLALGFIVALAGATQDIATDALAAEQAPADGRAAVNAVQGAGMAGGAALGGAVALGVAGSLGWPAAALSLAGLTGLCLAAALLLREPPRRAVAAARPSLLAALRRPAMRHLLLASAPFDLAAGATQMLGPMLVDGGLSAANVGWWFGTGLLLVLIPGSVVGGALLHRSGEAGAVALAGVVQAAAFLALAWLPVSGTSALVLAIVAAAAAAPATIAFYAASMRLASPGQAATDIALVACAKHALALPAAGLAGALAQAFGFHVLFMLGAGLVLAGAFRAPRLLRHAH